MKPGRGGSTPYPLPRLHLLLILEFGYKPRCQRHRYGVTAVVLGWVLGRIYHHSNSLPLWQYRPQLSITGSVRLRWKGTLALQHYTVCTYAHTSSGIFGDEVNINVLSTSCFGCLSRPSPGADILFCTCFFSALSYSLYHCIYCLQLSVWISVPDILPDHNLIQHRNPVIICTKSTNTEKKTVNATIQTITKCTKRTKCKN